MSSAPGAAAAAAAGAAAAAVASPAVDSGRSTGRFSPATSGRSERVHRFPPQHEREKEVTVTLLMPTE